MSGTVAGDECAALIADHRIAVALPTVFGEENVCAARVFAPTEHASLNPARLVFCFPGGGYSKEYYDPDLPGVDERGDYSFARDFARRGFVVVICDHLGVGQSSHPPRPERIEPSTLASANSQLVRQLRARFSAGELVPGFAGDDFVMIGLGHSMGGGLLTLQQAEYGDFDGIVTMGWSALHMPSSAALAEAADDDRARNLGKIPLPAAPAPSGTPGYARVVRGPLQHYAYHWDDVPAAVIEADDAAAVEFPPCATRMNEPGVLASSAAAITVPVFLLMGERDLRIPGADEASAYSSSSEVTSFELPASGHCHNLASSRRLAWQRIADWCETLERRQDAGGEGNTT